MVFQITSFFPSFASIAFANEAWAGVAIAFGVASVIILALTYRNTPLQGPSKGFAITLKLVGLILLALALMEPVIQDELPKQDANDLAILADNSSSLSIPLDESSPPPSELLTSSLVGAEETLYPEWLNELNDTFRLQTFSFDRSLKRIEEFSELTFDEPRSDLVSGLDNLSKRFDRRPLAAAIVLTDGNATDLAELEAMLDSWPQKEGKSAVPVFTVLYGEENPAARDLAISQVDAETTQFEDAQVTLNIEATARGDFDQPVEVYAVNHAGKELAAKEILFQKPEADTPSNGQTLPVRLQLSAMPPGISFLKVGIRQKTDSPHAELTDRNNLRQLTVNRGSGPYRILYVSGRPNWEYKFLRRSIAQDSEIELVGLIRIAKREPKFEWRGRTGESSNPLFRGFQSDIPEETQKYDEPVLIRLNTSSPEELRNGFPKSAEDLFEAYHAIIIDDVEAKFLTQVQHELLDQFVSKRGGTVVMLGGQESFQSGGWENTSVGRLLPVYLDKLRSDLPSLEATFNLTREGWLAPWMRLRTSKEEETNRLAYMPPFFAINQIGAIKPGASILATVTDSERRSLPAVITQRYGQGKSAAVTIADYWRWGMKDSEEQENLARTWRQLLRWSIHEVPTRVEVTKEELQTGTLPLTKVSVRVRDELFEAQDDANVVLTVTDQSGEVSTLTAEPSLEEPGLFVSDYAIEDSAGYQITASVLDGDGEEIGTGSVARALNPEAEELAHLGPDSTILERIASQTGGRVLAMDELVTLPSLLESLEFPVMEIRQRPLWHTPWLFLIALACFIGEWVLRRRQGIL